MHAGDSLRFFPFVFLFACRARSCSRAVDGFFFLSFAVSSQSMDRAVKKSSDGMPVVGQKKKRSSSNHEVVGAFERNMFIFSLVVWTVAGIAAYRYYA